VTVLRRANQRCKTFFILRVFVRASVQQQRNDLNVTAR
jgi:hypothetical protein